MKRIQRLRRHGRSLVVTIPKDQVEHLNLTEGDYVAVDITPVEFRVKVSPEDQKRIQRILQEDQEALRYLAEH